MTEGNARRITISDQCAARIVELLRICDEFVRNADPAVHAELASQLDPAANDYDLNLFIDDLGFTAMLLQAKLATAAEDPRQQATTS